MPSQKTARRDWVDNARSASALRLSARGPRSRSRPRTDPAFLDPLAEGSQPLRSRPRPGPDGVAGQGPDEAGRV